MYAILCNVSQNLQVHDTITYFQSVDLDGRELPLFSIERDQAIIQSLEDAYREKDNGHNPFLYKKCIFLYSTDKIEYPPCQIV